MHPPFFCVESAVLCRHMSHFRAPTPTMCNAALLVPPTHTYATLCTCMLPCTSPRHAASSPHYPHHCACSVLEEREDDIAAGLRDGRLGEQGAVAFICHDLLGNCPVKRIGAQPVAGVLPKVGEGASDSLCSLVGVGAA